MKEVMTHAAIIILISCVISFVTTKNFRNRESTVKLWTAVRCKVKDKVFVLFCYEIDGLCYALKKN